MGPRFLLTWKSRVGGGGGWIPRRDVPLRYTIRGLEWKRLSRWGGSLPWHTLTYRGHCFSGHLWWIHACVAVSVSAVSPVRHKSPPNWLMCSIWCRCFDVMLTVPGLRFPPVTDPVPLSGTLRPSAPPRCSWSLAWQTYGSLVSTKIWMLLRQVCYVGFN